MKKTNLSIMNAAVPASWLRPGRLALPGEGKTVCKKIRKLWNTRKN